MSGLALGIDLGIPFYQLDYDTRIAIEESLEDEDIFEPEIPWQVQDYLDWAAQQGPGADISIDAYVEWNQRQYEAKAGERLEEAMQPKLTDAEATALLEQLRREHDHTYDPEGTANAVTSSRASRWCQLRRCGGTGTVARTA